MTNSATRCQGPFGVPETPCIAIVDYDWSALREQKRRRRRGCGWPSKTRLRVTGGRSPRVDAPFAGGKAGQQTLSSFAFIIRRTDAVEVSSAPNVKHVIHSYDTTL